MTSDDFETMLKLVKIANDQYDGHLTVLKFTTNWRIGFRTPSCREDIQALYEGETFDIAASNALAQHEKA